MITWEDLWEIFGLVSDYLGEEIEYCLAGGALRDLELDKPVKDFDFFVKVESTEQLEKIARGFRDYLREELGLKPWAEFLGPIFLHHDRNEYDEDEGANFGDNFISGVAEFKLLDKTVQLIGFKTDSENFEKYVVNRFDLGFCRIYLDRSGQLHKTDEFLEDTRAKVIYFEKEEYEFNYERCCRLCAKYPDWERVNFPNDFEERFNDYVRDNPEPAPF